ncbi:hypothetical protein HDE_13544 [Halotydeus destructor]|nr:hypothetical protein HDE_13544 [Halotydeus destructor]
MLCRLLPLTLRYDLTDAVAKQAGKPMKVLYSSQSTDALLYVSVVLVIYGAIFVALILTSRHQQEKNRRQRHNNGGPRRPRKRSSSRRRGRAVGNLPWYASGAKKRYQPTVLQCISRDKIICSPHNGKLTDDQQIAAV